MNETPRQAARRLAASAIRGGYRPEALHVYTDPEGMPLHWRIRLRHPGTGEKWIRPMKLKGADHVLGEPEYIEGKPLYRLHDLTARPNDTVIVVEGEWCADALAKAGILAITSGAADSAGKADWQPLAGRTVVIWPDNDDAGQRYADAVKSVLLALDCMVRVIDIDALSLPHKGDAVNWLAENPSATFADVRALPTISAEQDKRSVDAKDQQPVHTDNDTVTIEQLAALSPMKYDRERKAKAEALGVRPGTLDRMVAAARKENADNGLSFDDVEPWPDPIEPAQLLTDISDTVKRFIVCQSETADAVALWAAMTWFIDVVQVAPLAVITAPEKRCGKSLLLFLLGRLSYRPLTASNISPAALFRAVDAWKPTLFVDEADAFMKNNEELRGLINCGHTRDSAYIVRVVGDDHTPRKFNVWGAKAIAGIGHLADTLMDRAILL